MTAERVEMRLTFEDFIAHKFQGLPFSREDMLAMAIDQVNDGKPLTIITPKYIYIISPESIAAFLSPPPSAAPEAKPVPGAVTEMSANEAPDLPGEPEAKPIV
jgi:hypothetical protein